MDYFILQPLAELYGKMWFNDAVEAHSCIDIVAKFTDKQCTTTDHSNAGHFDPRVVLQLID